MSRHRVPDPPVPLVDPGRASRRNVLCLVVADTVTGLSFLLAPPGRSPSLLFLELAAPLPVWGAGFCTVAVFLAARSHIIGHTLAVPLWLMWALGAALGVVGGTTGSPAASLALTGLVLATAALHANGLIHRRREARARRAEHSR